MSIEKIAMYLKKSNVAQTILSQIKAIDRRALPAWGAKDFVSSSSAANIGGVKVGHNGYLQMTVRGGKFMGKIIIGLSGLDLYDIAAFKIRLAEVKLVKHVEGIYADQLVEVLDGIIG